MEKPQSLFLFVLLLVVHCPCLLVISSPSNFTDQFALLAIKSKLTFDPTNTVLGGNWTTKTSFCSWIGVSCSRRRPRVTALDLSYMGLQGTISPHIGNLSFLVSLNLQNNSFTGFLPHEISRLRRLRILILQDNQLQGNIPPTLHHCQKLEIILLTRNMLSGKIPKELGFLPRLKKLCLSFNNLTAGETSSFLGNVSTLEELSLIQCGLTGSFPSALLNLSSLVIIYLPENDISGTLPADLCHYWPNIQKIRLSFNQLSGHLPSAIDECRKLVHLRLADNRFVGSIPETIGTLQNLEILILSFNSLTGSIPPTIGNLSSLIELKISSSNITGSIPRDLGHLSNIRSLEFSSNGLTGAIPQEIFNISSLQELHAKNNSLSGTFPSIAGVWLPNLQILDLGFNQITGNIPSYFSNFTKLSLVQMNTNLLYGSIPLNLGSLKHLKIISVAENQLTGEPGVPQLRFLSSLFNCSSLESLVVTYNPLNGIMPDSLGNISYSSLSDFYAEGCQIKGPMPTTLDSLTTLTLLSLDHNNISGNLPPSLGGMRSLQRLFLHNNSIEGHIPYELCHMRNLGELSLGNNKISGLIPDCIGNLNHLQILLLNSNNLTSSIPVNLWNLESLLFLDLSFNSFSGELPARMRNLISLQGIDLSWNQISGNIPSNIGAFQSLNYFNMSNNMFMGPIPHTFGDLKGLEFLDLSYNNLSGAIPKSLETLKYLKYINLSFNQLSGEIPSEGPFVNFTTQSFLENRALCGKQDFGVPPCKARRAQKSKRVHRLLKYTLPVIASTIVLIALLFFICTKYRKGNASLISSSAEELLGTKHRMISYHELRCATNDFCESNLLGAGSFGSVYKGILSDGTIVAVKVLNMQMEGASKSFDAECNVWRAIRHRNLVKVINSCSSPEVRALVLQYMSNGSLEKWLYSHNYCLNLLQRVSVLVDVALALEYLHHGQSELVVHCDLKPSNILLDDEMVAHVGDFGLAKILANNKDATQTRTLGTLGYISPEYGHAGIVSTRGDVYSFGIMLLELIVRKKPTDEMFAEELSLRQWINASLADRVLEVVDIGLLNTEEGRDMNATEDIIFAIMEIGLRCSEDVPEKRMDIKDVVPQLMKIKLGLESRN